MYERIKELCDKRRITIRELEKEAQLGNGVIGKWRTASPTLESLERVAKVLGVTVSELVKTR